MRRVGSGRLVLGELKAEVLGVHAVGFAWLVAWLVGGGIPLERLAVVVCLVEEVVELIGIPPLSTALSRDGVEVVDDMLCLLVLFSAAVVVVAPSWAC